MALPALIDAGLQSLGLRPKAATSYDLALLRKELVGTDYLGRTNPAWQLTGGAAKWLSPSNAGLRKQLVGQIARVDRYFAKKAAAVPWTMWRMKNGKREQIKEHPLLELLWRPNPLTGQVSFMRQQSTLYHCGGDAYVWANRLEDGPNRGRPTELWLLPPPNVEPKGGDTVTSPDFYRYTPDLSKPGDYIDIPAADMLHLKNDPLPGERYGSSCIVAANREATADEASITAQVAQLQNQGPPGVLTFPPVGSGDGVSVQDVDSSVISTIRNTITRKYRGPENRGNFPMASVKAEWVGIGSTAVDLDIITFRQANFRDICGYWGVPSELLGDKEKSTYNNVGEARKAMYTDGVLPYLEAILPEYSRWLCPMFEKGTWLEVDTSGIQELQADRKALADGLAAAFWIPVERKAELMGEPADPNFTGYFVPAGMVHVASTAEINSPDAAQKLLERFGVTDYK